MQYYFFHTKIFLIGASCPVYRCPYGVVIQEVIVLELFPGGNCPGGGCPRTGGDKLWPHIDLVIFDPEEKLTAELSVAHTLWWKLLI